MTEPTEATEHTGTVAELRDELRVRDLPISGTKDELIERLTDADAADADEAADAAADDEAEAEEVETRSDTEIEADEQAAAAVAEADLVTDEGEVKTDSVAVLTDNARTAVAEFVDWLDGLAVVLTDLEARNADPASGALIAASAKVRAHMDDVQRHLGPLSAACQALANEAAAKPA